MEDPKNPQMEPENGTQSSRIDETAPAQVDSPEPNSRRNFLRAALGVTAGLSVAELLPRPQAQTPAPFNTPELVHQDGTLRAVIQMKEAKRSYPNGPARDRGPYLRMFQGWYPAANGKPAGKPVIDPNVAGPGPTLRGKVGGNVEIMFLNQVDESKFPYSID